MTEVVQTLAGGSLGVAVVSDDVRCDLRPLAIEDWAERLAQFTSQRTAPTSAPDQPMSGG